jgi:DNA-binding transcriptional MerR regulator
MESIGQMGRKFGLSRSTLLYYDRLNLVRSSYRTAAGYRLYSSDDAARLRRVCRYRKAGLPLAEIGRLLGDDEHPRVGVGRALHKRLTELNHEIAALRRQQQVVIGLLRGKGHDRLARAMTKDKWVALLRSVGMGRAERARWHAAFERLSPEAHQDFLESLGIPEAELRSIREHSRRSWRAEESALHPIRRTRSRSAGTSAGECPR